MNQPPRKPRARWQDVRPTMARSHCKESAARRRRRTRILSWSQNQASRNRPLDNVVQQKVG